MSWKWATPLTMGSPMRKPDPQILWWLALMLLAVCLLLLWAGLS